MANLCLIFKTYQKSIVAYIKCLPLKRVVFVSRAETTILRAQTTTNSHSKNSNSTRFIVYIASATNSVLLIDKAG